ncbi:PREDICTED: putative methyltransferase DDB_G0268948 [Tarenaya hassleriana]|uniref:putative methyltransferase DDB_G0268948 n=1 Tax=Tarenaya hassleriana TaxID=28532 RepID=UPI00053C3946|nr:PREDICTED: putative methyltransferase DDB_G0268948 [Tarenaya hassleriana]
MSNLATLSAEQASAYKESRPTYPRSWYKMLTEKTTFHERAWDVGTGNGQAAVGLAEYYNRVVATDINQGQLNKATKHPKVTYLLTPESMSENELVAVLGGENSVDLVTAAQALHYFDLDKFYAVVKRVLRKPGGVIAVWVFNNIVISPPVDRVFKRLADSTVPFRTPRTDMSLAGYRTISFPFESVGIGSEGNPLPLDLPWKLSLDGFLAYLRSWQLVVKAKQQGVDLLPASLIDEFKAAWGSNSVKTVVYKFFMIAGKCKASDFDCPFRPPGGENWPQFPFPPPFNMDNMSRPPFLPPFNMDNMPRPPFQFQGRGPTPPWPRGFPSLPFMFGQ